MGATEDGGDAAALAVVTGAGGGVGRAIAIALARAGMPVVLVARGAEALDRTREEIEAAGGCAHPRAADVLDASAIDRLIADAEDRLGAIDLLVHCAGTGAAIGPTWALDSATWWRDVEVALRGAQHCAHAVLPRMTARRRGRIVLVSSRAGLFGVPHHTAYACSRAALFSLAESMAKELEPHGVHVFPFTPGVTQSALTDHILNSDDGRRWLPAMQSMLASGRGWVSPERVGGAVVTIASGALDALSGRWIHAQEDLAALADRADALAAADERVLRMAGAAPVDRH